MEKKKTTWRKYKRKSLAKKYPFFQKNVTRYQQEN